MRKIKALWPNQALILVCRQGLGEFFLKTRLVDEVHEIKKGESESYRRVSELLGRHSIERVISPHESLRTAFFARSLKARQKISFAKGWNIFFYDTRPRKKVFHPEALRQLGLLQHFDSELQKNLEALAPTTPASTVDEEGRLPAPPEWASMSLRPFYETQQQEVLALLAKWNLSLETLKKSVALFPGSVWATKRWTEEGFIQVGQSLSQQGVPVLVMGGPGEEALCARVAQHIPHSVDLCGKTRIFESALLLSQAAGVVGNDSASMHLAATSETPSVVIFGPTVLEFGYRPWQAQVYLVEKQNMECRPCGKHGHKLCPLGTHACMKKIEKEEVLAKVKRILSN